MMRKTVISILTALVLAAPVLGLAGPVGVASAVTPPSLAATMSSTSSPSAAADDSPLPYRVQLLAYSFTDGLNVHGRAKLRKNKRLWQHAPSPGPGSAHIVIRLRSGAVLGANDAQITAANNTLQQFYLSLPNARKLLKHRKHPVLVVDVTYTDATGQVVSASQSTKL